MMMFLQYVDSFDLLLLLLLMKSISSVLEDVRPSLALVFLRRVKT